MLPSKVVANPPTGQRSSSEWSSLGLNLSNGPGTMQSTIIIDGQPIQNILYAISNQIDDLQTKVQILDSAKKPSAFDSNLAGLLQRPSTTISTNITTKLQQLSTNLPKNEKISNGATTPSKNSLNSQSSSKMNSRNAFNASKESQQVRKIQSFRIDQKSDNTKKNGKSIKRVSSAAHLKEEGLGSPNPLPSFPEREQSDAQIDITGQENPLDSIDVDNVATDVSVKPDATVRESLDNTLKELNAQAVMNEKQGDDNVSMSEVSTAKSRYKDSDGQSKKKIVKSKKADALAKFMATNMSNGDSSSSLAPDRDNSDKPIDETTKIANSISNTKPEMNGESSLTEEESKSLDDTNPSAIPLEDEMESQEERDLHYIDNLDMFSNHSDNVGRAEEEQEQDNLWLNILNSFNEKMVFFEQKIDIMTENERELHDRIASMEDNEKKLQKKLNQMVENEIIMKEKIESLESNEEYIQNKLDEVTSNEQIFKEQINSLESKTSEMNPFFPVNHILSSPSMQFALQANQGPLQMPLSQANGAITSPGGSYIDEQILAYEVPNGQSQRTSENQSIPSNIYPILETEASPSHASAAVDQAKSRPKSDANAMNESISTKKSIPKDLNNEVTSQLPASIDTSDISSPRDQDNANAEVKVAKQLSLQSPSQSSKLNKPPNVKKSSTNKGKSTPNKATKEASIAEDESLPAASAGENTIDTNIIPVEETENGLAVSSPLGSELLSPDGSVPSDQSVDLNAKLQAQLQAQGKMNTEANPSIPSNKTNPTVQRMPSSLKRDHSIAYEVVKSPAKPGKYVPSNAVNPTANTGNTIATNAGPSPAPTGGLVPVPQPQANPTTTPPIKPSYVTKSSSIAIDYTQVNPNTMNPSASISINSREKNAFDEMVMTRLLTLERQLPDLMKRFGVIEKDISNQFQQQDRKFNELIHTIEGDINLRIQEIQNRYAFLHKQNVDFNTNLTNYQTKLNGIDTSIEFMKSNARVQDTNINNLQTWKFSTTNEINEILNFNKNLELNEINLKENIEFIQKDVSNMKELNDTNKTEIYLKINQLHSLILKVQRETMKSLSNNSESSNDPNDIYNNNLNHNHNSNESQQLNKFEEIITELSKKYNNQISLINSNMKSLSETYEEKIQSLFRWMVKSNRKLKEYEEKVSMEPHSSHEGTANSIGRVKCLVCDQVVNQQTEAEIVFGGPSMKTTFPTRKATSPVKGSNNTINHWTPGPSSREGLRLGKSLVTSSLPSLSNNHSLIESNALNDSEMKTYLMVGLDGQYIESDHKLVGGSISSKYKALGHPHSHASVHTSWMSDEDSHPGLGLHVGAMSNENDDDLSPSSINHRENELKSSLVSMGDSNWIIHDNNKQEPDRSSTPNASVLATAFKSLES